MHVMATGAGADGDALAAVLVPDAADPLADAIVGLVPGGPPPLAFATRAGADQRMGQPRRALDQFQARVAHRAEAPVIERAVGITLALCDPAALDVQQGAAATVAHAAGALEHPVPGDGLVHCSRRSRPVTIESQEPSRARKSSAGTCAAFLSPRSPRSGSCRTSS